MKAVILAGGRGERLKPLTNIMPKALAPINGIPILKQQIDNLLSIGINDFLILTGYRAKMIREYIREAYLNSPAQITIKETPENFSPAERLLDSARELGGNFLLLYCDNLIQDLKSIEMVLRTDSTLTFLVEKRNEGNVSIEPKVRYCANRSENSPFVELGYMQIVGEDFLGILRMGLSLQLTLEYLSTITKCSAVITANSLCSVSNIDRFNMLRKNRDTIFLDRDGILNKKMPHREYLKNFASYEPIDSNIEALKNHFSKTTDFIIVTNQPGVATKEVDVDFLDALHSKMTVELLIHGISIIGIYVCSHHWNDNCDCRKPKPGMINQAIEEFDLEIEKLVLIGDEDKDVQAATNAKILGIKISEDIEPASYSTITAAVEHIYGRITSLKSNNGQ